MEIKTATFKDIEELEKYLTPEDRLEYKCTCPDGDLVEDLKGYLVESLVEGDKMVSVRMSNGDLLMVGGWNSLGNAWFMTTRYAYIWPVSTVKAIRQCKQQALSELPHLWNTMMRTNKRHVKLLQSIGAEFVGPVTSIGGEPFQSFVIEKGGK